MAYNTALSTLLDKHTPVITKFATCRSKSSPWFSPILRAFRATVRSHRRNMGDKTFDKNVAFDRTLKVLTAAVV